MAALQFPCTIFKTRNRMEDHSASDMRCGDLTEAQLKTHYGLSYISDRADPWTLTRRTAFDSPRSRFCCNTRPNGEKITRQQCAAILFDEFRYLSRQFSQYGPYQHMIEKMITHMQYGNGASFRDAVLNQALNEQILRDNDWENSTRLLLKEAFRRNIDWDNQHYPSDKKDELRAAILKGRLPKFDRIQDNINGMGITVHDTWATHITIKSLYINKNHYRAVVHYKVQDHFGLDDDDIFRGKFWILNFFRIWFALQRYKQFGYKPFLTNIEAKVEISGQRNEE